jgi:hypothetical protein
MTVDAPKPTSACHRDGLSNVSTPLNLPPAAAVTRRIAMLRPRLQGS